MAELRFSDTHTTLYLGNSLHMAEIADNSVHCVVTSPPYWGQRVYKGAQELVWGGDEGCEHIWGDELVRRDRGTLHGANAQAGNTLAGVSGVETRQGRFCQLCGAWRGAYGLEPLPEMWIEHTLMFLREIRRVLRKDGIVWFNVDDKRWGSGSGTHDYREQASISKTELYQELSTTTGRHKTIKPLDLCLIPQRLAIAAQEDGWFVRSIPIWWKDNPMPESVGGTSWTQHRVTKCPNCGALASFYKRQCRQCGYQKGTRSQEPSRVGAQLPGKMMQRDHDGAAFKQDGIYIDCPGCPKCLPNDGLVLRKGSWRPTESYETILMLIKSNSYFADQEAVREAANPDTQRDSPVNAGVADGNVFNGDRRQNYEKGRHKVSSRNLRDVWRFPTQPYKGAHFATYPEKLVEIAVKASTSERGVCPKCGAQWARVIKKSGGTIGKGSWVDHSLDDTEGKTRRTGSKQGSRENRNSYSIKALGWRATCKCNAGDPISATVLDPFCGTGTTLLVAKHLGRRGVGYDISEEYCRMARERTKQGVLL